MPDAIPQVEGDLNEAFNRVLGTIGRRRWWLLLTTLGTTLGTFGVLSRLPNRYVSEATLLVVQQQVPQRYVVSTTTTDIREALQAATQEVLSRTRLLQIIDEFGLYPKQKKRLAPEALVELMQHDIEIKPLEIAQAERRELNAFKISYNAENPQLAQEVTSRLTSLFIEENLKTREHQATITTDFLQEQRDAAKKKLSEQEERVRNFKMQYLGELPEQQPGNLAILAGLQTQLQNTMAALSRAQQQRVYLESLQSGYRSLATRSARVGGIANLNANAGQVPAGPIDTAEKELARLRSEKATLLGQYTPQHPDVIKVGQRITEMEALLKTLRAKETLDTEKAPANPESPTPLVTEENTADAQLKSQLEQIKSQLESNRLELENLTKDEKELKSAIAQYQNRLNQTPVREQQLAELLRDHDLLKLDYADLLSKEMQSELAANLEKRQQGQQFRLIDRPSLPSIPSSPNRVKISLGGVAGGIALGLVLALLADFRDRSFHSEKDLIQRFPFPLVVGVPLLLTPSEHRERTWKRVFEWAVGSGLVLVLLAAEFYEFYIYRHG